MSVTFLCFSMYQSLSVRDSLLQKPKEDSTSGPNPMLLQAMWLVTKL